MIISQRPPKGGGFTKIALKRTKAMKIEQQNVSVDLDEMIDADCYEVKFVAQVTNTKGLKYDIKYYHSHENGPCFRETLRDILERAIMRQQTKATAFCAKKNGVILKELDIKFN